MTITEVQQQIATAFDTAIQEPLRVLTLRAKDGVRRKPVIMISESEYQKLKGEK